MDSNELKALLATLQSTQDGPQASTSAPTPAVVPNSSRSYSRHSAALSKANDVDSILGLLKKLRDDPADEASETEETLPAHTTQVDLPASDESSMPSYPSANSKDRTKMTFAESLPVLTSLCLDETFVEVSAAAISS